MEQPKNEQYTIMIQVVKEGALISAYQFENRIYPNHMVEELNEFLRRALRKSDMASVNGRLVKNRFADHKDHMTDEEKRLIGL